MVCRVARICSLDLEFRVFFTREQLGKKRSGNLSYRCACLDYLRAYSCGVYKRKSQSN